MKLNYLIPFFIIVILLFSFGCMNKKTNEVKESTTSTAGIISYQYSLNGKNSTVLRLYHGEQAEVSVKIKNMGQHSIENVTLKLISCLDPTSVSPNTDPQYSEIMPNSEGYFSFTLYNDISLASQEIKCPSIVRVFFDYTTDSYHDIAIMNKNYSGAQPKSLSYSDNELLSVNYELPSAFRLIDSKIISGRVIIKNLGTGLVDYPNVGHTNEIKEIDIRVPSDMKLIEIGGYKVSKMDVKLEEKNGYRTYKIVSSKLTQDQRDVITRLAVGAGNTGSAYIPIKFEYDGGTPEDYKIERIYVKLYYGYSYDLFKFNLVLGKNY